MKADTGRILKSGWGAFLTASLILSAVIDLAYPSIPIAEGERFYLLGTGSALVGWFVCVGLFVMPSWVLRNFGIAPVAWWFAVPVCLIGYLAWMAQNFDASRDMQRPPSLTMVATLILGWRMLRTPRLAILLESHPRADQGELVPFAEFAEPSPPDQGTTVNQSSASIHLAESAELKQANSPERDKLRLIMTGMLVILVGLAFIQLSTKSLLHYPGWF